jgi:hypothetical protein
MADGGLMRRDEAMAILAEERGIPTLPPPRPLHFNP